ncbi:cytochrome c maturation protein CcmE [Terrihabitans sp. B22-R8]|uniref:cytochrome c maturation protein CcmE n=1 Tax=Terrihabitans sp. B22-R8 TaxID=3425128 RepID=UPI00403D1885
MTRKGRRLALIGSAGTVLAVAVGLVLTALNDTIVFFSGPTQLVESPPPQGTRLRMGGLVAEGSVRREGPEVHFAVSDGTSSVPVTYKGLLPDLFREGQGVVTEGELGPDGMFRAASVLAKHDESYMPKEVADALKAQGTWKGDEE